MAAPNLAEIMYPNQQGNWRIELKYLPIGHRGHAFLALIDGKGKTVGELHGLGFSKHTGKQMTIAEDGADLRGVDHKSRPRRESPIGGEKLRVATVSSGAQEEMERIWAKGAAAVDAINKEKFDYKSHDPSYEFGTDGGQIQNSNSVAFTLGKAMGLDMDRAILDAGMGRRFSGWGRDLLDPKRERYVAAPPFPVRDAP